MRTKVESILEGMKLFVQNALNDPGKYLCRAQDFTRHRILSFDKLCFFIINQSKRSLSIELDTYFGYYGQAPCTKGAFSKARYRVLWSFFRDWHRHLISLLYKHPEHLATWKGHYLKGIDGTTLYLFRDEEVEKTFGTHCNQYVRIPMARAGLEVDVLNGYCTQAQLQAYWEGEKTFAEAFLDNATEKDLLIYDRYFASFELIFKHLEKGIPFLMRCKLGFNQVVKKFVASGKKQALVSFSITDNAQFSLQQQGYEVDAQTSIRLRLLRIDIGQKEPEILITNLLSFKRYPQGDFKAVYNYRWADETKFDQLKNKLQIEIFSGHKPQAIYQDFFATIIAANLHNLILRQCDQQLEQINTHRKIPVAINHNVSIGLLRPRLINLFTTQNPESIFMKLKELFLAHLEPVRPGRMYPRTKTVRRLKGKFQTFKNYRRAC